MDRYPDIEVQNEGSIFLFHPVTDRGANWIGQNISNPTFFGNALVVEHRYAEELAAGMLLSGLRLV